MENLEKKLLRITRHYNIAFKKDYKKNNPLKFKKNGDFSKNKNYRVLKENWSELSRLYHDKYCRAFNFALKKGFNFENDVVIGSSNYAV